MLRAGLAAGVVAGTISIAPPAMTSAMRGMPQESASSKYRVDVGFQQKVAGKGAHLVPLLEIAMEKKGPIRVHTIPGVSANQNLGAWPKDTEMIIDATLPKDSINKRFTLEYSVSGKGIQKVGKETANDTQIFRVISTSGLSGTQNATITGTWVELLCSSTTKC